MKSKQSKSKRCINCNCKIYPRKHIPTQEYCSRKSCQNVRRNKWVRLKLKTDSDYRSNKRKAQRRWTMNNPDYWKICRRNKKDGKKLGEEKNQQKRDSDKIKFKKPVLKILLQKNTLASLCKTEIVNCDCELILIS